MSLAIVHSRACAGIQALLVTIEVHLSRGLPGFSIVGLPEKAVKESKDRVRSALINCDFEFPIRRIVVNLAPADLPKIGGRFDLPIAIGILAASGQLPKKVLSDYEFVGELALSGDLLPIDGVLPFAIAVRDAGRQMILPQVNANEAALIHDVVVLPANHLLAVCAHLHKNTLIAPYQLDAAKGRVPSYPDLKDVKGQVLAKRALEMAAAGGHSLLMSGPPGSGKTMLASRLPSILPPMTESEALASATVCSISNQGFHYDDWGLRPFRSPHHTASSVALVGGGSQPQPGEISLAHHGVLFLDELPEFSRHVLEALREPLEAGTVTISRAAKQAQFPANFQLIAAMNPCPCGYFGDSRCQCSPEFIQRYQAKISGPLLDRIDIHLQVQPLPIEMLLSNDQQLAESSSDVRQRVVQARQVQWQRFGCENAALKNEQVLKVCVLKDSDKKFLEQAARQLGLSARAFHRVLKVARTIADLESSQDIERPHLQEALGYRQLVGGVANRLVSC